jgi:AraC-like DNA-binding protein
MIIKNLPHDFSTDAEKTMPVIFRTYRATQLSARNKSVIHENMIDIVLSGKKKILNIGKVAHLEAGDLIFLSKGNCLISEVLPENGQFNSLVIYFTNEKLSEFRIKYDKCIGNKSDSTANKKPFLVYQQDNFTQNYIASVQHLLQQDVLKTAEFIQLKLEELLLYLLYLNPDKFHSLLPIAATNEEMLLRSAAEHNICNPVTVEDLAFLCNMSMSTFKRKFFKIYGTSPVQWLLKQRLQLAASLLDNPAEKPGIVFEKVGYGNHSSFSQAFKKQFGITPTEYQERKMNV